MTRIELHIEELVLHGFSPHDRARIGDALEAALATQLAAIDYTASRDASCHRIDAGSVALPRNAVPGAIGGAVADAVAGAIRRLS